MIRLYLRSMYVLLNLLYHRSSSDLRSYPLFVNMGIPLYVNGILHTHEIV